MAALIDALDLSASGLSDTEQASVKLEMRKLFSHMETRIEKEGANKADVLSAIVFMADILEAIVEVLKQQKTATLQ